MTLTPALPAPSRPAMRRHAVRSSCAMALALALATNPGAVSAQSFLGNGVPMGGAATITPTLNNTVVTVLNPEVVIDWDLPSSPGPGTEVFQPAGTTATFVAGGSFTDFTVLNRILPTDGGAAVNRAAQLNGTVNGSGNIWFYSPSGIIIGSSARFDVGSLVLTSNAIDTDGGLYGSNGEIRFRGAASSLAPVEIQAGAVINAGAGPGDYLAIVAPRIVQAGTINANGHIALVAAEQVDITVNIGLLDILVRQEDTPDPVRQGSTDPNGIIHTGSTGGPASTDVNDRQVLSLIAMPKNTAMTMMLSGRIGYIPAALAESDGSSVVLSAGHASYIPSDELAQNLGSITIGNTEFTSAVTAVATNAINLAPIGGSIVFRTTGNLTAFQSLSAIAGDGEAITSGDSLFLRSNQGTAGGSVTVRAEGGTLGGQITAANGLYVSASGESDDFFPEMEFRTAAGGTVIFAASGGRISAETIMLDANGRGLAGGDGRGGSVLASVGAGGSIAAAQFTANADGIGGFNEESPERGGDGFGGAVSLVTTGGTTSITGSLEFFARGYGADGSFAFGDQTAPLSGNGTGGSASTQLSGGSVTAQSLVLDASGIGGRGAADLSGTPGSIVSTGGDGTGGNAQLGMAAGSTALLTAGTVQVTADGAGGAGGFRETGGSGNGGSGRAGNAGLNIADGGFSLGATTVQANGMGGSGEIAGSGVGGTASFVLNDSLGGASQRSIATLSLYGRGFAEGGNSGPATATTAGQTQLVVNAGSPAGAVTLSGDFIAEATGTAAPAGNGFTANVGGVAFNIGGNTTIITNRDVSLSVTTGGALATQGVLNIATPRSLTATGLISSAGDASIAADLGISMTDLRSGGATRLSATGGAITVSNDLSSAGIVTLLSAAANVRSLGALNIGDVGTSGDFAIEAAGDLLTGTVAAAGNVALSSTGGLVQTTGTVSGANIAISAAGGVVANADLVSTGDLQIQTGGTLQIGGRVIGTTITAVSGDIALGPNGNIGQRGTTQSITLLNANPGRPTFIGGAAQSGGYSLDAAEARRLAADSAISLGLSANAGANAADLVIGDLALTYGANGNIGTGGVLKINAPGRIAVNGAVALTTSSSSDRFSIDPTRIEINTDTGSIIMQDTSGGLLGQLELVGGTIAVASGATLAAIANLSNPVDINAALDAAPANPNTAGYLQASSILLNAENAIYIANTGASAENADRRGFTANSLSIITGSPATHVSINGVLIDASGAVITGLDTLPLVTVNGAPATVRGLFSRFSTVNGCVMAGQSCEAPLTNDMIKTKSDIEVPLDPEGSTPQFTYVLEIEERETDDQQPLVDEPVTGVGNDDLWNGDCGSNPGACPQGGNSQ